MAGGVGFGAVSWVEREREICYPLPILSDFRIYVQNDETALAVASLKGHSDVAEVLLEKGGGAELAKIQDAVSVRVLV